jgi:hypothetical protein
MWSRDGEEHTLTVITEAHLCLSQTNCVLSLTHSIELLQLSLVDTLDMPLALVNWR